MPFIVVDKTTERHRGVTIFVVDDLQHQLHVPTRQCQLKEIVSASIVHVQQEGVLLGRTEVKRYRGVRAAVPAGIARVGILPPREHDETLRGLRK